MLFRTPFNTFHSQGEIGVGLSLAEPNKELTIKEMLSLMQSGRQLPACGLDVYYDDRPDLENITVVDREFIDFSDVAEVRKQLFYEQEAIVRGVDYYRSYLADKERFKKRSDINDKLERYLDREIIKETK